MVVNGVSTRKVSQVTERTLRNQRSFLNPLFQTFVSGWIPS
ncbi:hypothetical protein P7H19_07015 [Paenibacillus larvae]|nr:hypothetical protein [Paenibacillus larvae]